MKSMAGKKLEIIRLRRCMWKCRFDEQKVWLYGRQVHGLIRDIRKLAGTVGNRLVVLEDRGDTAKYRCLDCGSVFEASPCGEENVVSHPDPKQTNTVVSQCPGCFVT